MHSIPVCSCCGSHLEADLLTMQWGEITDPDFRVFI
jgi:hypothetical protein